MNETLPPGQRESNVFHRFGLTQFAKRFPNETSVPTLEIKGAVSQELRLTDPLHDLPRVEQVSNFHCVTTWSYLGLRWEGVKFSDFYSKVIVPQARPGKEAKLVALRGQDGAYTGMLLEDLLASDVLFADKLNGEPLPIAHGGPLRLVVPAHYGYKSVKYLCKLEFKEPNLDYRVSGFRFMDHPRVRVAFEERGRMIPGRLLRCLYRPLIRPTISLFSKAEKIWESNGVD